MEIQQIHDYGIDNDIPIIKDDSLRLLIDTINDSETHRILEIGTAIGYSSIAMARNCDVEITSLEFNLERVKLARQNIDKSGLQDKIKVVFCDAGEWLKTATEKYDLIFLDGPKGQYIRYLPYLIDLIDSGGIIFADNVYFKGMVRGDTPVPKSIKTMINRLREYLDVLDNHTLLDTLLYDIGDGIAISTKK